MSAAFDVVFALFVVSMFVLAVVAVRWGHQRDRAARAHLVSGPPTGGDAGREADGPTR